MHFHDDRGSRRRRDQLHRERLVEMAPAFSLGLEWRELWRAEQAGRVAQQSKDGSAASQSKRAERAREPSDAAAFAAAIARAEFGRLYWSEKAERRIRSAKPRDKRNGGASDVSRSTSRRAP